ncbi:MAG: hypothetical protein GC137_06325 [Alphaproteobacteria bacterium]|nr:hypothetical protein [Alphaproteobacteria bacterium]
MTKAKEFLVAFLKDGVFEPIKDGEGPLDSLNRLTSAEGAIYALIQDKQGTREILNDLIDRDTIASRALAAHLYGTDSIVKGVFDYQDDADQLMDFLQQANPIHKHRILAADYVIETLVNFGYASKVMDLIDPLDHSVVLGIFSGDGAVGALSKDPENAEHIIDFLKNCEPHERAQILRADDAVAGLADAGYADDVMDFITTLTMDETRAVFSGHHAVASLAEHGYVSDIWDFIEDLTDAYSDYQVAAPILCADDSIYALTEDPRDADRIMEMIRTFDDRRLKAVFSSDYALKALADHGYGDEVRNMVDRLSAEAQEKISNAKWATEVLGAETSPVYDDFEP